MNTRPAGHEAPPRRRRARRLLLWLGIVLLALVLAAAAAALWLLRSGGGRDFALSQLQSALPPGALQWSRAEGTLAGGLALEDLRLQLDGSLLQADRLRIDLAPMALLGRTLQVQSLQAQGLDWRLSADPEPQVDDTGFSIQVPDIDLPIAIALQQARIEDATLRSGEEVLLDVASLSLAGRISRDGRIRIRDLALDADRGRLTGEGRIGLDGQLSGNARLQWTGTGNRTLRIELEELRQGVRLHVAESGTQQAATLSLQGDQWRLQASLQRFDPSAWFPEWTQGPLTAVIEGSGSGWAGTLSGRLVLGAQELALRESRLALVDGHQALQLDPLHLALADGGTARIQGRIALAAPYPAELQAQLVDAAFSRDPPRRLSGELQLSGTLEDYTLRFDGVLDAEGEPVDVLLAGSGNADGLAVSELQARSEGSSLAGSGRVQWSPQLEIALDATLQDFDPARFFPEFPGALSGEVRFELALAEPWRLDAQLQDVHGTLRGRALRADGRVALGPEPAPSDLRLRIGESDVRVNGRAGDELALDVALSPLRLPDLMPDAGGTVEGTLRLRGPREAPRIAVDVSARALDVAGLQAERATLEGTVPGVAGGSGELVLQAEAAQVAGQRFATLRLEAQGSREAHALVLQAEGAAGLRARVQAGLVQDRWSGTLRELVLVPEQLPTLQLDDPAGFAVGGGVLELERACLAGDAARVCAQARSDADARTLEVDIESLPLALAEPWLAPDRAVPLHITGQAGGSLQWRADGDGEHLEFALALPEGELALEGVERRTLLDWRDVQLRGALREGRLVADLAGTLEQDGRVDLHLEGDSPLADAGAALEGSLALSLPRLRVLELLSPEVANPAGRLDAELALSGQWNAPSASGRVEIAGLSAELPGLGVAIDEGRITLRPEGADRMRVDGTLPTGEGALQVQGTLDRLATAPHAQLTVTGERVLVVDTPLARAVVSPALELDYAERVLELGGSVSIPEGRIDLDYLEDTVQPSPDVVVLDPREGEQAQDPIAVQGRIEVTLGEDVQLQGYGFDGSISGTITVRERPGRLPTARGRLELAGTYEAYGQELELVRGRLLYSNSPLDNPALDLRAEREIGAQTVGLDIDGSALTPIVSVYSSPNLPEAEALGYLVLGRPLSSATEADSAQLSQAAVAVGGNLLAEKLGSRLGFDTFGVSDSRTLGGSAFTVGKYLSPKLYVSYGVALFGSGQVLSFSYILNEHWQVEIESGAQQNRVGLKYRIER